MAHPALATHLARGGRAVYASKGLLMWADGDHHEPLIAVARLPSTLNGRARHKLANAMAAFAALLALAAPKDRIAAGLASFSCSESQSPLRLSLYRKRGVMLMFDGAHSAAAYAAIIATGRQLTQGRLIGVVAAPGDRQGPDLMVIGRLCGAGFDGVVVYETDDQRHPPSGLTAGLIARGARAAQQARAPASGSRQWVHTIPDIRLAIRDALAHADPGDLIIVGSASHLVELRQALGGVELAPVDAATLGAAEALSPPPPADAGTPLADEEGSPGSGPLARVPQADLSFQP